MELSENDFQCMGVRKGDGSGLKLRSAGGSDELDKGLLRELLAWKSDDVLHIDVTAKIESKSWKPKKNS
jgi:hypothetical protein